MNHPIGMKVLEMLDVNAYEDECGAIMPCEYAGKTRDDLAALIENESGVTELIDLIKLMSEWLDRDGREMLRDKFEQTLAKFKGE